MMLRVVEWAVGVLAKRRASARPTARAGDSPEVAELLAASAFLEALDGLADQHGRDRVEVRGEAADYLREMSAVHAAAVERPWERLGDWMARGYDVLADDDALAELRRLDRRHPLIFLISHRSYLDEFVLPPLLVRARLDPPYGLAGGANLNFFPSARSPAGSAWSTFGATPLASPSTGWRCAPMWVTWSRAAPTSSGRSRGAAAGPGSCVRPATGFCVTSATPSSRPPRPKR